MLVNMMGFFDTMYSKKLPTTKFKNNIELKYLWYIAVELC